MAVTQQRQTQIIIPANSDYIYDFPDTQPNLCAVNNVSGYGTILAGIKTLPSVQQAEFKIGAGSKGLVGSVEKFQRIYFNNPTGGDILLILNSCYNPDADVSTFVTASGGLTVKLDNGFTQSFDSSYYYDRALIFQQIYGYIPTVELNDTIPIDFNFREISFFTNDSTEYDYVLYVSHLGYRQDSLKNNSVVLDNSVGKTTNYCIARVRPGETIENIKVTGGQIMVVKRDPVTLEILSTTLSNGDPAPLARMRCLLLGNENERALGNWVLIPDLGEGEWD